VVLGLYILGRQTKRWDDWHKELVGYGRKGGLLLGMTPVDADAGAAKIWPHPNSRGWGMPTRGWISTPVGF